MPVRLASGIAALAAMLGVGCESPPRGGCDVLGNVLADWEVLIDKRIFYGDDLVDESDDPVIHGSVELVDATVSGAEETGLPAVIVLPPARFEVTEDYLLLRSIAEDDVLSAVSIVRHDSYHCDALSQDLVNVNDGLAPQEVSDGYRPWWELPFLEIDWSREGAAHDLFLASLGTVVGRRTLLPLPEDASDIVVDGAHFEFTAAATVIVAPPGAEKTCYVEDPPPLECLRATLTLRHRWDVEAR